MSRDRLGRNAGTKIGLWEEGQSYVDRARVVTKVRDEGKVQDEGKV
jgi:hypothetical protein